MKYIFSNTVINPDDLKRLPFKLTEIKSGSFKIYIDELENIFENEEIFGITDGYIRDHGLKKKSIEEQVKSSFHHILSFWPLPENISGSFSSILIEKKRGELIFCTDLIGLHPLYYYLKNEQVFISNSIILLGAILDEEIDTVGVLQRSIGQDFSNIGSRTIINSCKRLLPGEFIKIDNRGNKIEVKYDNSLYQNISAPDQKHQLHYDYWEIYKQEVDYCLISQKHVKVALSGGIDSRLVLGTIPNDKQISCYTFGAEDNYETKIASKLAKLQSAKFKNFYQPELYFPSLEILEKYTLQTEAVQICSWLEIIENVPSKPEIPILLGELCEGLPARNIFKYSSRNFRQDNFIKYYLFGKDYQFEIATPDKFEIWKNKITHNYLIWYAKVRLDRMKFTISEEDVKMEVKKDLDELFQRIEAHNLPFIELYDELFSWYTYTRMRLAKQLQIFNGQYNAYSPAMSLQVLRKTSNLHPNLRLNYRFAKKLFKHIPELRKYNKIPTSQAPLVPQYFPDFIKFPIWGIRSKIDSFLIKRMMKTKNIKHRYRLFKSIDWARVYHHPQMERNLELYFKNNNLGEKFYEFLLNQSKQRKELKQWPFANIDIINSASLNIEMELIKKYKKN